VGGRMSTDTCPKQVEYRLSYRVDELAKMCGVSTRFIRDQIKSGDLRAYRLNTNVIILTADADVWLRSNPVNSDSCELGTEDLMAA
jgi:excisionase family DNA binding protein